MKIFNEGKMRLAFIIIFITILITGCTVYYTQKGKNTADFNRDKKYCEGVAEKEAARKGTRVCDEVDRCLVNTKGWKRD